MNISNITDDKLLQEIQRRFNEKQASIDEMEKMTKKLLILNEKNKKSQEVKSKFLSLIKNEFNNPMSSLLNIANRLVKKPDMQKTADLSSLMKTELLKLDFSLKNIFCASEIEAGEISNDFSIVKVEDIFDEVKEYFSFLIDEKSLQVEYSCANEEDMISDSQKINLILLNLVSNACEYAFHNSLIEVDFRSNDEESIISVTDRGESIPDSQEIYSSFYHYESGNARRTAGLGLGLSVISGLVDSLNGTIEHHTEDDKITFRVKIQKVNEEDVNLSKGIGANEFIFDDSEGMVEF